MKKAVIALGGNAILPKGSSGDIHEQFANTRKSVKSILRFLNEGYRIAITHGNGPQAGNELVRNECARDIVPELPLGVIVAATEGWMGYMIEQSLQNALIKNGINREVVTIPTQIIVDRDDPAWNNPTKPIGRFMTEEEARVLMERGIPVVEDAGRGWRRVVPSPDPKEIVEKNVIKELVESGHIVIAAGGGGIPVYIEEDGTIEGLDGVIDKDLASAVLAKDIEADILVILTAVPSVYLNFGKPDQRPLRELKLAEARKLLAAGEFPKGSMGPKIEAACRFIEYGGKEVLITSLDTVDTALAGNEGTRITG